MLYSTLISFIMPQSHGVSKRMAKMVRKTLVCAFDNHVLCTVSALLHIAQCRVDLKLPPAHPLVVSQLTAKPLAVSNSFVSWILMLLCNLKQKNLYNSWVILLLIWFASALALL
jgi:hypothetical protein